MATFQPEPNELKNVLEANFGVRFSFRIRDEGVHFDWIEVPNTPRYAVGFLVENEPDEEGHSNGYTLGSKIPGFDLDLEITDTFDLVHGLQILGKEALPARLDGRLELGGPDGKG